LVLYGAFVFIQTVRHREYFLAADSSREDAHAPPPTLSVTWTSAALLLVSLVAVVGLAKALSPAIESTLANWGAPESVVGIIIALLVLLPEGLDAAPGAPRMPTSCR